MPTHYMAFSCRTCQVLNQTDQRPTLTAPLNDMFAARTSDCKVDCGARRGHNLAKYRIFEVLRRC